jgi:CBS domain containing-hemolysin-like protein
LSEKQRLELVRKFHSRLPIETDSGWGKLWVSYDSLFKTGVESREPAFVELGLRLEEVLKTLRKHKSSFAYVRDENGKECGIVTVEDVLRRYLGKLEI